MRRVALGIRAILVFLVIVWLAAQGRQWLFRTRSERLLADIKALNLNHSTWSDAQRMMDRWGKWGYWQGDCNAQHCEYTIDLDDLLPDAPTFVYVDGLHIVARVFDHLGLRSSWASARFTVVQNVVTNKSFRMSVALPFRDWGVPNGTYWPSLDAEFSEAAKLSFDNPHYRDVRPNHAFVQRRILLRTGFTPEETPEEQAALMDLRLDCVTRWFPCRSRSELSPRAEQEMQMERHDWDHEEKEGRETQEHNRFTPTCFPTVEIRAREEHDVLLGDVMRASIEPDRSVDHPRAFVWKIDIRLIQLLKGRAPGPVGSIISVSEPSKPTPTPSGAPWPFRRVVVTGMTAEHWRGHNLVVYPGDCGVVEASPENLAAVLQGVKDDFGPR